MMWIKICLLLGVLAGPCLAGAAEINEVQKKQMDLCVGEYLSRMELLCSGKRTKESGKLVYAVMDCFSSWKNQQARDFDELANDGFLGQPIHNYLETLDDIFDFKVTARFYKGKILDCATTIDDHNYGVYTVEKTISVNGKFKMFSEVILVTLPADVNDNSRYKIAEVLLASKFNYQHYPCSSMLDLKPDEVEKINRQQRADTLLRHQKDYLEALKDYMYLSVKYPDDDYSRRQIDSCRKYLDPLIFRDQATRCFNGRDYAGAETWYGWHFKFYPDENARKLVNEQLRQARLSSADLNYDTHIKAARAAFARQDFDAACDGYREALKFKPDDPVAKSGLEQSNLKNDSYAYRQIDSIVRVTRHDEHFYPQYFKILDTYEGSVDHPRLTTIQYYNMVQLLNARDRSFIRALNFSAGDADRYLRIYCKKLSDAYSREHEPGIKNKVEHLLNNVINPGYQTPDSSKSN